MISFEGHTAFVTGAAGGIGLATAELFFRHGARLMLTDLDEGALRLFAQSHDPAGHAIAFRPLDVTSSHACSRAMEAAAEKFGGIDSLVHCAGIYPESLIENTSDEDWRRTLQVNLDGTFFICRAALPYLRKSSSVVLLASIAAARGSHGHAAYAASKGAMTSFARSLAMEAGPDTRVNAVAPGIIATAMTESLIAQRGQDLLDRTTLGRHGTAADVAGVIAFLCSPLSGFMTGEILHVNGGLYMG
ncbi:MAG TPA: SDR family NAD(P)-dependent oxidoreductase [Acidobacteriaceae bacterium]|nr:SDR family NAD(P)-dependent oxidoreductase [Acidobacteriaceae bacterium]